MGFDQMRHGAADAAMAVTQQSAMGVERHFAVAVEIAGAHRVRRLAALARPRSSSSMASVMVKLS
jgi:hypothetical protein